MILNFILFACPLILASVGALYSEFTGTLALFLEGLINLSSFLFYLFTDITNSFIAGIFLTTISTFFLTGFFAFIIEKMKANKFVAALGMNILFSSIISLLSFLKEKNRGVLTSPNFVFSSDFSQIFSIIFTIVVISLTILFLVLTKKGSYIRISGENENLLIVRGINPKFYRTLAWSISGLMAGCSGIILAMNISAFVPGNSGGKGWMALAAVFLGKKKWWKIILFVLIFCLVDFLSADLQKNFQAIPSSLLIALPYIIILTLISLKKFI